MAAIDIGTAFVAGNAIVASDMNARFTGLATWANGSPNIGVSGSTATMDGALTVTEALTASSSSQFNGTVTLGVDDTGVDLICYGAATGAYMKWNQATDDLQLVGAAGLDIAGDIDVDGTTNLDAVDIDGAVQIDGTVTVGVDGTGFDVKFFGDTATNGYMLWDGSEDDLIFGSAVKVGIGGTPAQELDVVAQDPVLRLTSSDTTMTADQEMSAIEFYQSDSGNAGVSSKIAAIAANISGAQNLGFYTGTAGSLVQNMVLDSNGKLGIGTTAPTAGLHLFTAVDGTDQLKISSTDATVAEYGFLAANSNLDLMRYGYWTGSGYGTHHFEGWVMVGKTSHDGKAMELYQGSNAGLRIQNSTTGTGTGAGFLLEQSGGNTNMWLYHNGSIVFGTNDTTHMTLFNTGNLAVSTGGINAPGVVLNTTASAANMHISAGGWFYMYSSSQRYKTDIEDLEDAYADKVLDMRPVWYRSSCSDDRSDWSHYGFIAEEIEDVDPRLVTYGMIPILDDDGKPTFEQVPMLDSDGNPVYERVPVLDDDGNPTYEQIEGVDEDGNPTFTDGAEILTDGDQRYEAGDQLVERDADGEVITRPNAVEYTKIIPMLVNLIQRQDTRIAALEAA